MARILMEAMMPYVPFLRFNSAEYNPTVVISVSVVMLIVGLMALLYGWKLYKFLVIVSTALAGAYLGWYVTYGYAWCPENLRFLGPIVLGLLGGVLAIPMQRLAVFFVGASVGFVSVGPVAAQIIWDKAPGPTTTQYLIVSLIAFILMGITSLLVFKAMAIIATSLFGATLALSGGVQTAQALWFPDKDVYAFHQMELAAVFVVLAVSGVIFQATTQGKKKQPK
jgi:hypothetical protein